MGTVAVASAFSRRAASELPTPDQIKLAAAPRDTAANPPAASRDWPAIVIQMLHAATSPAVTITATASELGDPCFWRGIRAAQFAAQGTRSGKPARAARAGSPAMRWPGLPGSPRRSRPPCSRGGKP